MCCIFLSLTEKEFQSGLCGWAISDPLVKIRSNQITFYLNSANSQQKLSQNTTCRVAVATLIVVTFQLLITRDPAFYHEQELGEEKLLFNGQNLKTDPESGWVGCFLDRLNWERVTEKGERQTERLRQKQRYTHRERQNKCVLTVMVENWSIIRCWWKSLAEPFCMFQLWFQLFVLF